MTTGREWIRRIELTLAMLIGFGALVFWYWIHWQWAEARDEHQRSWPCASFQSYPMKDVPLRCLPGASKDGGG